MLGSVGGRIALPESYDGWKGRVELLVYIVLWYATSVVCTNTSKQLGIHWSILTLSQLSISSVCGFLLICCFRFVPFQPVRSSSQLRATALLAAVFTMGFLTLNSALGMMHVSLVMTLRATEPLFTLALAAALLKTERASPAMAAALLPVIAGAGLSSVSSSGRRRRPLRIALPLPIESPSPPFEPLPRRSTVATPQGRVFSAAPPPPPAHPAPSAPQIAAAAAAAAADFHLLGLAVATASNVMFALRGVLTKRLRAAFPVGAAHIHARARTRARARTHARECPRPPAHPLCESAASRETSAAIGPLSTTRTHTHTNTQTNTHTHTPHTAHGRPRDERSAL